MSSQNIHLQNMCAIFKMARSDDIQVKLKCHFNILRPDDRRPYFLKVIDPQGRKCLFAFLQPCCSYNMPNCRLWTLLHAGETPRANNSPVVIVLNYWLACAAEKHHNRLLSPVKPRRSVSDPLTSLHLPRPPRSITAWNVDLAFMSVWTAYSVDGSIGLIERSCRNMALGWPPGIPFDPRSCLHRVPQCTHAFTWSP